MTEQRDGSGFRLRGLQMTRLETFTDAAFAFALTLLVISLNPPTSFEALIGALQTAPVFLLSASMLMLFWWGHHQWSRRYGLDDGMALLLSCVLVFTVLLYVYPLRFMFGAMWLWLAELAGIPLVGQATFADIADVNRMFVIYGIGFVAMSSALVLLNVHAWRQRERLVLDAVERHETRATIGAWLIVAAAGVLSIAVGLFAPASMPGLPGWVYAPLGVLMPLYGRAMDRRRPRQPEQVAAPAADATPMPTADVAVPSA